VKRAAPGGNDFHPELRSIARFLPRHVVGPATLPLLRVLTGLQDLRLASDVDVLTLSTGARCGCTGQRTGATPDRDLFYDEDIAYAERLRAADVPCQVEIVPGPFHSFDVIRPKAGVSQSFFASQCAGLREVFAA
jgi:hypothetical protein